MVTALDRARLRRLYNSHLCSLCVISLGQSIGRGTVWQSVMGEVRNSSFIHSSMALQPFVGPWPLLQFRNLFLRRRWDPLDE
jgi:hypothetical protein